MWQAVKDASCHHAAPPARARRAAGALPWVRAFAPLALRGHLLLTAT